MGVRALTYQPTRITQKHTKEREGGRLEGGVGWWGLGMVDGDAGLASGQWQKAAGEGERIEAEQGGFRLQSREGGLGFLG